MESYLGTSIASNNDDLNIKGYKPHRVDHPNNVKRGGVCVYITESLRLDLLVNHGRLNKKIQPNLCNTSAILIFNELYLFT